MGANSVYDFEWLGAVPAVSLRVEFETASNSHERLQVQLVAVSNSIWTIRMNMTTSTKIGTARLALSRFEIAYG